MEAIEGKNSIKQWVENIARQHGKDETCLIRAALAAVQKPGTEILYLFPTITHSKEVMLKAVDEHTQQSRIDTYFPFPEVRKNKQFYGTGRVELRNGSIITFGGYADDTRYRGKTLDLGIISEAAFDNCEPVITNTLEPMLAKSAKSKGTGWLIVQSTPNGKNPFYNLCQVAKSKHNDGYYYYSEVNAADAGYFNAAELEQSRQNMIDMAQSERVGQLKFEAEYMCSFESGSVAQVYPQEALEKATSAANYDPEHPLYAAFDIGYRDPTAIWCFQFILNRWHFIDCYTNSQQPPEFYAAELPRRFPTQPIVILPHDAKHHHPTAGKSYEQIFSDFGYDTIITLKPDNVEPAIQAVIRELPNMTFDKDRCAAGLHSLANYRRKRDRSGKVLEGLVHNEHCHYADALRYAIQAKQQLKVKPISDIPYMAEFREPQTDW